MLKSMSRTALLSFAVMMCGFASPAHAMQNGAAVSDWSTSWSASPSNSINVPSAVKSKTIRQVVTPHSAGATMRLRLTNRYGKAAVKFSDVYVGTQSAGAAVVAGTNHQLTFGGSKAVSIPAGEDVVSDPVDFTITPFRRLLISMDFSLGVRTVTQHATAREKLYYAASGHADDESGAAFATSDQLLSWFAIEAVEVQNSPVPLTVIALGDSITDGYESMPGLSPSQDLPSLGSEHRYPDLLQRRILAETGAPNLTVVDAGISGNRVLKDGYVGQFGPSALSRLDADVLAIPNVTTVILLEGINDFGFLPFPTAAQLEDGLEQIIDRLHQAGIRVLLGTLTPAQGSSASPNGSVASTSLHATAISENLREAVNGWIRTSSEADAVIDFEACMRDPAFPKSLLPAYDSGDHLHPNDAGYQAMANCVDLKQLY